MHISAEAKKIMAGDKHLTGFCGFLFTDEEFQQVQAEMFGLQTPRFPMLYKRYF